MDGIEDKLNSILSSPDAMEKILSLARSFSGPQGEEGSSAGPERKAESGGSSSLFGDLDPAMLRMLTVLMSESGRDSEKEAVIHAIAPYLKDERRDKVDRALKIARMAKLARTVLSPNGGGVNE